MRVYTNSKATIPQAGQMLRLTRRASPQFVEPIIVRVLRVVEEWTTYEGWVWIDVYQIGLAGEAVEKRRLFVKIAGLDFVEQDTRPPAPRRSRNERSAERHRATARTTPRVPAERMYTTAAGRRIL